jgi:hypothetical protein
MKLHKLIKLLKKKKFYLCFKRYNYVFVFSEAHPNLPPSLQSMAGLDIEAVKAAIEETTGAYRRETHTRLGALKLGGGPVLDDKDAQIQLMECVRMLELSARLESKAAKLKAEALSQMAQTIAGANVDGFWGLFEDTFGELSVSEVEKDSSLLDSEEEQEAVADVDESLKLAEATGGAPFEEKETIKRAASLPAASTGTKPKISRKSTPTRHVASDYVAHNTGTPEEAQGYIPSASEDKASAAVAKNLIPRREKGEDGQSDYWCLLSCAYSSRNRAAMVNHIRRDHLKVALQCYVCGYKAWATKSWSDHLVTKHPSVPQYPAIKVEEVGEAETAAVLADAGL